MKIFPARVSKLFPSFVCTFAIPWEQKKDYFQSSAINVTRNFIFHCSNVDDSFYEKFVRSEERQKIAINIFNFVIVEIDFIVENLFRVSFHLNDDFFRILNSETAIIVRLNSIKWTRETPQNSQSLPELALICGANPWWIENSQSMLSSSFCVMKNERKSSPSAKMSNGDEKGFLPLLQN